MESFSEREGYIWKDGEWCDWRDARLHVLSHGLHYGSCVFEGERAYGGVIYKLHEHNERLKMSALYLDMELPYSVEEIDDVCQEALKKNGVVDGYVRPFAWRGSEMMAVSAQDTRVHVAVGVWKWPNLFSDALERGLRADFAEWRRPAPETAPWQSKAAGLYMIGTLSKHKAEREGYDEAIFLDHRGYLAEATGANMFLVIDGELHTPTADCFLDGITRRTVMGLALKAGVKVVERHILPEELGRASEVFVCGTAAEVTPVSSIGAYHFNVGGMSKTLMEAYREETRSWKGG